MIPLLSGRAAQAFRSAPETEPRCRHFGACGGCQLQHLSPETQVQGKLQLLRATLAAIGVQVPSISVQAASPYAYRNRIRLRVAEGRVGYSRAASNDFLPISECPIAAPGLWHAAEQMQVIAREAAPWPGKTAELELVANSGGSELQVLLHVDATVNELDRDAPRAFRSLCDALQAVVPELRGAGLLVQGVAVTGSKRVQDRQRIEVARWGQAGLTHTVNGISYPVSRGAFFQVNRFLTGAMVDVVVSHRTGTLAWDLFAGAGLFTVPLASCFTRVVGVEVAQPAATDLAASLLRAGPQHRAAAMPVLAFLERHQTAAAPQLVVVDPPRAGLGGPIAQHLARIGAEEIVYVSCDPATFARDAKALVDSRYAVAELHLFDLFPQTVHTETIAVFRRG